VIVLDSSAAVDYLLDRAEGSWVAGRLLEDPDLHSPHLVDLEVASALTHVTTYDAAYVAPAEELDATLITTDLGLARSHGHRARIVAPE
jgi:predicted nucleic acid-binding protein